MTTARRLYVLTGASRGLGAALAEQLLAPDVQLLTLSRHPDESLGSRAHAIGALLEQWTIDIGHDIGVAARLEAWLHRHGRAGFVAAALINNAGLLGHVGPIDSSPADDIAAVLRVDLEAPMLLTSAFLRATRSWPIDRRVLSISSGAGKRAVAGWATYCAARRDSITSRAWRRSTRRCCRIRRASSRLRRELSIPTCRPNCALPTALVFRSRRTSSSSRRPASFRRRRPRPRGYFPTSTARTSGTSPLPTFAKRRLPT